MTPHPDPIGLEDLFEQVDDWFVDLTAHEPISHYAPVRRKPSPIVAKATNNKNKSNCRSKSSNTKKPTLDSLARDLELLLEGDSGGDDEQSRVESPKKKTKAEPEIFHFNICNNDELALLDDSIGSCFVTYGKIKNEDAAMNWTSVGSACDTTNGKEYSVSVPSHDDSKPSIDYPNNLDANSEHSNNKHSYDRENNDLKVQTTMPRDHDYLAQPRINLSAQEVESQYLSRRSKHLDAPALHTGVIMRFARFSSRFKELSLWNDRSLVPINNSHNKVGV